MRCGTKQFIVTYEDNLKKEKLDRVVYARTPAEARKNLRLQCGKDTKIYVVKEK